VDSLKRIFLQRSFTLSSINNYSRFKNKYKTIDVFFTFQCDFFTLDKIDHNMVTQKKISFQTLRRRHMWSETFFMLSLLSFLTFVAIKQKKVVKCQRRKFFLMSHDVLHSGIRNAYLKGVINFCRMENHYPHSYVFWCLFQTKVDIR
jgi:hypothetical protein